MKLLMTVIFDISLGPLGNLYELLNNHPDIEINEIYVQGGFAGTRVMDEENILPKFKNNDFCPTFNFNGHVKGAFSLLNSTNIKKRYLVSKDVCHSVYYGPTLHELVRIFKFGRGDDIWDLLYNAMNSYLKKKPMGKLLHDPLTACTACDPSIITFREVEVQREKGNWGSIPSEGTNTFISVQVDIPKFYSVFLDILLPDISDKIIEINNQ